MAIRLSGLTSGMDTDAIVQELVSAYSKKTEKYEKASTKLTWKQDAWKNLNTKIYGLYTNVSNLRFSSAYTLRKTSVSDATKAKVTASSTAVTGTQTLNIRSTAQASYITGGQLDEFINGKEVTSESTLKDLGFEGEKGSFKLKSADGTSKKIEFTKDTTIAEVVNKLKEAGVNANFDENNRRIFVSAKNTGEANDFDLIGDTTEGLSALTALGLNSSLLEEVKDEQGNVVKDEHGNALMKFTDAAGNYALYYQYYEAANAEGKEVWDYLKGLYNDYLKAIDDNNTLKAEKDKLENTNRAWERDNEIIEEKIAGRNAYDSIMNAINSAEGNTIKDVDITDADTKEILNALKKVDIYTTDADGKKVVNQTALDKIKEVYKTNHGGNAELSDDNAKAIAAVLDEHTEDIDAYRVGVSVLEDGKDIDSVNVSELTATLESNRQKMAENVTSIEQKEDKIAENNEFIAANPIMDDVYLTSGMNKEKNDESQAKAEDLLGKMATSATEAAKIFENANGVYSSGNATKIKGSDAVIELNGVTYTSESNNFNINGLSIEALAETTGEISITTSVDTQGIYDKVKDFLTEYNNVINEMAKLYNADSASDYEPLTDEEKEAMSDEQIEKWENKIKDSLLRRDTTLNSVMSAMVNSMAQVLEIDGQKLSLSTFGIHTLGFLNSPKNEHYAYHIDGDEDDENTSGNDDELMKAIQENPEQVEAFMKKLSENLYKAIDNKMKSTELSSAYKVYNDKEMDKEAKKYTEAIAKWEEKVKDKEDYYYKQFSNMEVALSKLQNQTSSLSGLLGM